MTKEEAIYLLSQVNHILVNSNSWLVDTHEPLNTAFNMAIEALDQEPCEDCISRQAVLDKAVYTETEEGWSGMTVDVKDIEALPSVNPQKIGYCKDCKWWKDSDGVYRRGIGAESQCPMNRIEVLEGNGYCYMFKPQESEEE